MKLSQLEYFCTAVEKGHITEASQVLNVTQPALTSTIRRMEEELGVSLIEPAGRNFKVTLGGEIVYRRAQEILLAWKQMERELQQFAAHEKNTVEIICLPDFISPSLMQAILEAVPDLILMCSSPLDADSYRRFLAGEIDLIINHPMYTGNNVESVVLEPDEMVIVTSEQTWGRDGDEVALHSLTEEKFAAYREGVPLRREFETVCLEHGFSANIVFEANTIKEMLPVVMASNIFVYAPRRVLGDLPKTGLRVLKITDMETMPNVGISWLKSSRLKPTAKIVRDCMIRFFHAKGAAQR